MPSVLSKFSRTDEQHVAIKVAVIEDNLSEVERIIQQNPQMVKDPFVLYDTWDLYLLDYAIINNGSYDCVALLISLGADIDRSNYSGPTPLHYAAKNGDVRVIKLLLQYEPKVCLGEHGGSPLHWAAIYNRSDVLEVLLRHDCSLVDVVSTMQRDPPHKKSVKFSH